MQGEVLLRKKALFLDSSTFLPDNKQMVVLIPSSLHHFQVDLFQLQVNTLRRYKRHYKLQTRPGLNKAQLAEVSDDRDSVIFIIKTLFISSAHVLVLWTLMPVVTLARTYRVLCKRFQEMTPTESCLLAFTWDSHGRHGSGLLKACFSNLLLSASFPSLFVGTVRYL